MKHSEAIPGGEPTADSGETDAALSAQEATRRSKTALDLETIEIQLFLEGVFQHYGYDFREYSTASLRRRLETVIESEGLKTISGLQERVLHDPACLDRFLIALSVTVTSLFRDPGFFLAFRERVVPILRTYPFIRIWHAGCSTGEEVYSMAILLTEEGLYDRCRIYATDMNEPVVSRARSGIFPTNLMNEYSRNYEEAGGRCALSDYVTEGYGSAIFHSSLKDNIVFSPHNLAVDSSFNEFNVILCRNVMIYFKKPLQHRVHHLLGDRRVRFGILEIGSKENWRFTPHESEYEPIESDWKLYRRIAA